MLKPNRRKFLRDAAFSALSLGLTPTWASCAGERSYAEARFGHESRGPLPCGVARHGCRKCRVGALMLRKRARSEGARKESGV